MPVVIYCLTLSAELHLKQIDIMNNLKLFLAAAGVCCLLPMLLAGEKSKSVKSKKLPSAKKDNSPSTKKDDSPTNSSSQSIVHITINPTADSSMSVVHLENNDGGKVLITEGGDQK